MATPAIKDIVFDFGLAKDLDADRLLALAKSVGEGFEAHAGPKGLEVLEASTSWKGRHLREALRRAFRPYMSSLYGKLVQPYRRQEGNWLLAILAGKVPALTTGVVFRTLAARVPLVLKPPSSEPNFASLLVKFLYQEEPRLKHFVHLVTGRASLEELIEVAPVCLVYGRDETVKEIWGRRKGRLTLCGGHRESFVVVFKEALEEEEGARRLALEIGRDCSIYDGSGCLSPKVVLVEEGGRIGPKEFARLLFEAMWKLREIWPSEEPGFEEAAALRLYLGEARFRARLCGGYVFSEERKGLLWPSVAYLPNQGYERGPGKRSVQVLTFRGIPDLGRLLPGLEERIQGAGVAGPKEKVKALFETWKDFRPNYLCRPGRLQMPKANWPENGIRLERVLAKVPLATEGPPKGQATL